MRKILNSKPLMILLTVCGLLLTSSAIYAEGLEIEAPNGGEVDRSAELFDAELEIGTQSPWTKKVPVTLKFRSEIDSDNAGISWDSPSVITIEEKHLAFMEVVKGETYTVEVLVSSKRSGEYEIAGNITAWQYDTNYTSSISKSIKFGDDGVTIPQTTGYSAAVIIKYLVVGLSGIVGIIGLLFGAKIALKKLKVWLTPPI